MGMAVTLKGLEMKGFREALHLRARGAGIRKSPISKDARRQAPAGGDSHAHRPAQVPRLVPPQTRALCTVDLLITKASGGRWRFPIHLEATEPEVDGAVQVESHAGDEPPPSSTFPIQNEPPCLSPPTSPGLPAEFAVTPERGVMEPGVPRRETTSERASAAGTSSPTGLGVGVDVEPDGPGAQFRITYAPTEYGTDLVGRLVIVTDENTWVFEVVGTIPEYNVRRGGAKVTTRLDPGTKEALREAQRKRTGNIVLQNTKKEFYTSKRPLSRTTGAKGK